MGKHSKPEVEENPIDSVRNLYEQYQALRRCTAHEDGVHYYGAVSIDEGQCRCGARIRQNNSGH
jgi:hypothetical protein